MTEPNRQSGEKEERIIEIEIERLRPFKEHPFQVKDDKEMFLLQESIEKYGILNPLIVRPVPDGYYEIISGHRRKHATVKKLLLTNKKYPYDFKIEIIGVYLFYLSSSIILYLVSSKLNINF